MKKTKSTIDPSEDITPAPAGDLKKVADMAENMLKLEDEIIDLQFRLQEKQQSLERIASSDLPALMNGFGLKEFKLKSGHQVVVRQITKASLPSESAIEKQKDIDKQAELRERFINGLKYLEKQGAGAMIKNIVEAELGKDSAKKAKQALQALKKLGIAASVSRGVHPQTLSSWVRERIEQGLDVDFDLLAVYNGEKAEIKTVKPKQRSSSVDLGL